MDRPLLPSLTSRIGTAMLLAAMALTALPAGAGAWSTVPESGTPIVTTKSAAAKNTKATKPAKAQTAPSRTRAVARRTTALTVPTRGPMALGVSLIEGNTPTEGDDLAALDAYAQRTGRMPASWSIWSDWGNKNKAFPSQQLLHALRARGVRPVIFWQPTGDDRLSNPTRYSYQSIVDGEWDAYLTNWAQDARAWGGRVIVRWAHEMNGWWFPWAIGKIGNTPENYRAAWRHVVTLVRGIAPNARFMWAPMRPCGTRCVDYAALYPGDAYVNVLGFSAYNWSGDPDTTMLRLYRRAINGLTAVSSRKIIAAETGIKGPGPGRDRWLREGYEAIYKAFPKLRGVIYFDIDMSILNEPEWRLMRSDNSLDTYSELLRDARFMGKM